MRPNKRTLILDAAIRVAERDGVLRLTLEATADEAGVTRGGMTYHFRDRDALIQAMYEHLASGWEARLVAIAGKTADEATRAERTAAYITLATTSATRGELELIHATGHNTALHDPLDQVQRRWTPSPEEAGEDPQARREFLACLAADGLWSYDSLSSQRLSDSLRSRLSAHIADLARSTPDGAAAQADG